MISDSEPILDLDSMWEYFDIPLDVPLTEEDVQRYRTDKRLKDDIKFRKYQRKMFNKEFSEMAKEFPAGASKQPIISCSEQENPSGFQLKRAKILSSVCLTAKEPFSQGHFKRLPTVLHWKILTYLTGFGGLHTRALWISMRSELNKYDRAWIKNASLPRAEASFLDRVSMNLFELLKSRRKRTQLEVKKVSFREWQKEFFERIRLKRKRRLNQIRLKSDGIEEKDPNLEAEKRRRSDFGNS